MMDKENKSKKQSLIDLMPQDAVSQHILAKRAQQFAKPIKDITDNLQETHYVRFKLGENEQYGIPYNHIKEVIMNTPPTRVPYTTSSIAGIINRHGVLICVLDLKHYFNLKQTTDIKGSHLIVVSAKGMNVAISVNTIVGSDSFNSTALSPPLQFEGTINPSYVKGLHKSTIAILKVEALIASLQINSVHIKESM